MEEGGTLSNSNQLHALSPITSNSYNNSMELLSHFGWLYKLVFMKSPKSVRVVPGFCSTPSMLPNTTSFPFILEHKYSRSCIPLTHLLYSLAIDCALGTT